MQPCEQKDRIDELHDKLDVLTALQIKQAEIDAKVSHVKERIDNGMSNTITRIDANLTELKPVIEHHADIVKRIEDIGWFWSKYSGLGFIVMFLGLIVWAITKGFVPKI